jgi:hypothetical protein
VSHVSPIFAELLDEGAVGPDYADARRDSGMRRWIDASPLARWSRSHEIRVADGCVVTGIQLKVGSYINGVRLHQTPWDGTLKSSDAAWTPWWTSKIRRAGTDVPRCYAEPKGASVVIGIGGRTTLFVSELSIVTANVDRVQPSRMRQPRVDGALAAT